MPQGVPGTPSGTYAFALSNMDCVLEAFARCRIRPTSLTASHMQDAQRSLNLVLQSWANKGINLFGIEQNLIQLVAGQATYILPAEVVSVTDAYYNTVVSTGAGPDFPAPLYDPMEPIVSNDPQIVVTSSQDRWLQPRGRNDIAMIPDKQIQGLPSIYWQDRLGPPYQLTLTFWPVPIYGYPNAAVTYFAVRQLQDASVTNGETPDVPNRFLDALCADLAVRLARKYEPELIGAPGSGGLLDERNEYWALASGEDTEKAPISIAPTLYRYWQV